MAEDAASPSAHPGRAPVLPLVSARPDSSDASVEVGFDDLLAAFPLPWLAYVRLWSAS